MAPTRGLARALAVTGALLLAVAAGVGWLYLLRASSGLDQGPRLHEALPLERLARGDAQPLGRLMAAWLPAGVVAGLALGALTSLARPVRAALAGAGAWALIALTTAASHAVTESEPFTMHLARQPSHAAPWVAAGLVAVGALMAPSKRRGRARDAGATPWDSPGASAA